MVQYEHVYLIVKVLVNFSGLYISLIGIECYLSQLFSMELDVELCSNSELSFFLNNLNYNNILYNRLLHIKYLVVHLLHLEN